jgi:1,2-diacylglycerol 3-alpha-glucosyltransferase
MTFAVCFTNFGPYHLARLRALAALLAERGDRLVAYEVAGREQRYPWSRSRNLEPFEWVTFFPDRIMEALGAESCRHAMRHALDRDRPDAVGIVGYVRPESMAAARWARRHGRPAILLSESQAIDRPVVWWKEIIKRRRVLSFDAALVGGPSHRDHLAALGMEATRIALGYNAVDNEFFATRAQSWRENPQGRNGLPPAPYFLTVCRFVPEKNLLRLIAAFAQYRRHSETRAAWDLVLCGDGPLAPDVDEAIAQSGCDASIHRAGFRQAHELPRYYAHASALVLPSISEPWGLVANEAAASGVPLLLSERAGCAPTLVPDPLGTTGWRFDPFDLDQMSRALAWMDGLPESQRTAMGCRAALTVADWGPGRFARGCLEALEMARLRRKATRPARAVDLAGSTAGQ